MIAQSKKIEFWNFLIAEKNQPRPKGITVHRLALLKPAILEAEKLWEEIIEGGSVASRTAAEFYESNERASINSRACFWAAVRKLVNEHESNTATKNRPAVKAVQPSKKNNPGKFRQKKL